ncbi:archease [Desulfonema magnum]|uniref:Protein archease family protein n=1 Tax=Desulfonema magnum TaxID=45655 RepID=A0A975GMX7_9BACT|nr:archease [Desulfonema magnum]QTA87180.1 Protein archease family protein [Desulfonema magnum]
MDKDIKYNLIDHTADFGMHVFGSDMKELFGNAARAMFDVITDINKLQEMNEYKIHVSGDDWPDLMVNWLREMLFLWTGRELLVKKISILSLCEYELTASVMCDLYDPDTHFIKNEIKAVTYHQIEVYRAATGWESKIIFDV